jgi:hypothetical protein
VAGREQAQLLRQDRRLTLGKREQVTGNLESDIHPSQGRRGRGPLPAAAPVLLKLEGAWPAGTLVGLKIRLR